MNHPRRAANEVRGSLGITGPVNIEHVAKELGVRIIEIPCRGEKVKEVTFENFVGVRKGLPRPLRNWVIAHGLGHIILHQGEANQVWLYFNGESAAGLESEAEDFAFHLLVGNDRDLLFGMGDNAEIARFFGVPLTKLWPRMGALE